MVDPTSQIACTAMITVVLCIFMRGQYGVFTKDTPMHAPRHADIAMLHKQRLSSSFSLKLLSTRPVTVSH